MKRVFRWQLAHLRHRSNDWTNGAFYAGMMAAYGAISSTEFLDAARSVGVRNNWQPGPRKRFADDHCIAQTYLEMYLLERNPAMLRPTRDLYDQIIPSSTNELLTWQDEVWLREWAWCDALFMAPPVLALLYKASADRKYLEFMTERWWKTTDFLYDKGEHLFYRDSRYFSRREPNGEKVFWGRGNGWVMAGLVRVLKHLPEDHLDRHRYIQLFREVAARLVCRQHHDGFWTTSLLDPESFPGNEASATGLICYALAWGVRCGILTNRYNAAVKQSWGALVSCVARSGRVGRVQAPGAQPVRALVDSWEVYGAGAFLLAGSQLYSLASA